MTLGSDWALGLEKAEGPPLDANHPSARPPRPALAHWVPLGHRVPLGPSLAHPLLGHLGAQSRQARVSCFLFRK